MFIGGINGFFWPPVIAAQPREKERDLWMFKKDHEEEEKVKKTHKVKQGWEERSSRRCTPGIGSATSGVIMIFVVVKRQWRVLSHSILLSEWVSYLLVNDICLLFFFYFFLISGNEVSLQSEGLKSILLSSTVSNQTKDDAAGAIPFCLVVFCQFQWLQQSQWWIRIFLKEWRGMRPRLNINSFILLSFIRDPIEPE